ncbi:MAG TPA: OmpA family protein [Anaeromyxobacter sp.]|nr:OmpA family protein [Anaeromyxobacter sp.]
MRPRRYVRPLAALTACLTALQVHAADDPTRRGFDADPTRPALSLDGNFAVETAEVARAGTRGGALLADYAAGLLSLQLGGEREPLLRSRLTGHLLAQYSFSRAELGLDVPVVALQRSDFSLLEDQGVTGPLVDPVARTALGDLRAFGKVRLLSQARAPLALAALLDVRLPTGDRDAFAGDGLSAVPGVVLTRAAGRLRLDLQLGYWVRGQGQYAQLVVHDGFTGGLAAAWTGGGFGPVQRTRLMAELLGGVPRGLGDGGDRYRAPLSARGGVRLFLPRGWAVEAGGGAGLGEPGWGREAWRVYGGVRWVGERREAGSEPARPPPPPPPARQSTDRDGDGVPNEPDACPDTPGPEDMDGCPDRDGDFIPDPEDKCPDEPGPAQNDGCPVKGPVVELETERLSLRDSIHFDTARDTIKPQSNKVLDAIATLLRDHPELRRVRVEGHTDNRGSRTYNIDLSQRRARSVVRALVQRGIDAGRLVFEGYGFDRPVATNATALGRAKNRRVEFTIMEEK